MKIAQVTPYFLPVEGGVERHVFHLSKELEKRGHEVKIFTCSRTRQNEPLERRCTVQGLEVSRFDSLMSLGEFGRVWPGFVNELYQDKFDVIHAHAFRHPHADLSMAVSKLSRSTAVLTSHSPFHPPGVRRPLARALVSVYDNFLAPTTLGYFDKVISLTPDEAAILARMGVPPGKSVVIPHGVEAAHFSKTDPSIFTEKYGLRGKDIILSLGRINRTKGLDVLLESFAIIAKAFPEVALVVAGGCTSPSEERFFFQLRERAKSLGVEERVLLPGKLTEEEKASAFEACLAFVLPSVYEPYGIVLLEAAAHGKPLIATAVGGPKAIIEAGVDGILVPPGDVRRLAAAILQVVIDRETGTQLGEEARSMAREHTWEKVAEMTEAAYITGGRREPWIRAGQSA